MIFFRALVTLFPLALALSPARAEEPAAVEPLKLPALDGTEHAALDAAGKKGAVLFFISPYCPTSNTFIPEMNKIAEEYGGEFAFRFIQTDKDVRTADAQQQVELQGIKAVMLLDRGQLAVKKAGATKTPEAVVLGPDGKTLYQGRINDLYLTPTRRQREAKTRELRDALDSLKAGKPVAVAKTEAAGCTITLSK